MNLERIRERRAELKAEMDYTENNGISLIEFAIEKLIEAEEKLAVQETAFAKIENYCNQVYQAALQEKLGLQTSLFVVGAILGAVHKVLGKEVEELK